MKQEWELRPVTAADASQIAVHGHFAMPDLERQARYAAWVAPRIETGSYIGWFAVHEGRVIGGAGAVLLDWGPTRSNASGCMARIANVYIEDCWRRRGVARALLNQVLAQCESRGIGEFNLGTTPVARSLYESLGFESYPAEMRRRVAAQPA